MTRLSTRGPLSGFRVLDLADETGVACTRFLADLGADVIKIEPPLGDPSRAHPPFAGDQPDPERSLYFLHWNANKRGVTLNLETAEGQEHFRRLVRGADVVVETFRPGTMERWGLGYERLAALNSGVIVTSITSFGQTGPYRDYAGDELIAFALGGVMALSGEPGGAPCLAPGDLASGMASMHAAAATMGALLARAKSGRGQHIDVSLVEAAANVGGYAVPAYSYSKQKAVRVTHTQTEFELHDVYPCRDGGVRFFILVRDHWRAFLEWIGSPSELCDPIFEDQDMRRDNRDLIDPYVREFCKRFTKLELYAEGQARHLAISSMNTPAEFVESEQTRARQYFVELEHPLVGKYRQARAMHAFSESPAEMRCAAPLLGQHNDEILGEVTGPQAGAQPAPGRGSPGPALGPLSGIRVLELCTGAAGPTCARTLADYGAEVLKVESRRHPDNHRGGFNQARWNKSPSFIKLNRGKRSVAVNLQTERGRELVLDLARQCDVVVENFSLGVMKRWGLGYDQVRAVRPDVIYISLKGLGSTGPQAHYVTWGPNLLCLYGMTYLWNHADSDVPTAEARVQHPDFMAGVAGAGAVMAAVLHRQRTGKGQFIDAAQIEVGANLFGPAYLEYLVNGRVPTPVGNRRPGAAPHGAYPCVGGPERWCAISIGSQEGWRRFCRAIGDPQWCRERRFGTPEERERHWKELDRLVGEWTVQHTGVEVMERLQAAGVAAAPIQDVEDQFLDPHLRERGFFVEVVEPVAGTVVSEHPPVRLSDWPLAVDRPAPLLGEHTDQVLAEILGLRSEQLESLKSEGVLD